MSKRCETTSQCAADVACSNNPDFHACLSIQVRIRSGFLTFKLDGMSRHFGCETFFAISKVMIFPSPALLESAFAVR
jgi:hypothetical protein